MKEIILLIPVIGYFLFVRDSIRWAKKLAEKDPNPNRAKYTNLFLITLAIFAIPVFMIFTFLFSPALGAVVWSIVALFYSFYVSYGLYKFLKSKIPELKSKYKIEPITPEFKIFREPEVKVSASAINKHVHVLAPTGSGKTKSIVGPILQQAIDKGLGIMNIDPKGDNEVSLACIDLLQQQGRLNDLWYYDVMLPNYSRSYNPLYSGIKYNNPAQLGVLIIATMPKAGGAATFYEKVQSEFTRAMVRLLSLVNHTGKMANFIDLYSILAYLPKSIEYLLDTYKT
ncbi:MAG: type IV secretory system conjugative DNA transfer family protein, partial [Nitrosotalea sp.]